MFLLTSTKHIFSIRFKKKNSTQQKKIQESSNNTSIKLHLTVVCEPCDKCHVNNCNLK